MDGMGPAGGRGEGDQLGWRFVGRCEWPGGPSRFRTGAAALHSGLWRWPAGVLAVMSWTEKGVSDGREREAEKQTGRIGDGGRPGRGAREQRDLSYSHGEEAGGGGGLAATRK